MNHQTSNGNAAFDKKVWRVCGIVALVVAVLWIAKTTVQVLLLILTAALVALFFRRLAALIRRYTGIGEKLSLLISVLGTLLLVGLFFWFIGARVSQQIADLTDTLPATIENIKGKLNENPLGQRLMRTTSGSMQKIAPVAQRFFSTSFGVLGDLYAILFLGIFFTVAPRTYVHGIVQLVPAKGRAGAQHLIDELGKTLGQWLKGQLFAMLVVAVLTGIGLGIIGVPMALALALIAGILNFVPNIGPLIAMVPAVLVSLMQGGNTALLVAGLYLLVQALESNLITPFIQNKLIQIPPALILIGQLIMGVLLGAWGIILATPIVAMLMVIIKELYVKKQDAASPSLPQENS